MSDDAKLGMVAGVLAVVAVAIFGYPKDLAGNTSKPVAGVVAGTSTTPPGLPPAAVQVPTQR